MINPAQFFHLVENADAVKIQVRNTDMANNRSVWGELEDSFTADDLSAIAQYFENQARYMRGEHLS